MSRAEVADDLYEVFVKKALCSESLMSRLVDFISQRKIPARPTKAFVRFIWKLHP